MLRGARRISGVERVEIAMCFVNPGEKAMLPSRSRFEKFVSAAGFKHSTEFPAKPGRSVCRATGCTARKAIFLSLELRRVVLAIVNETHLVFINYIASFTDKF